MQRNGNERVTEKPKSAAAVIATLAAVTAPVPNRRVSLSLCRLETIVPSAMIMEMMPAYESGTPNSVFIVGQAEPSRESGRPRLIKARYMIVRSKLTIYENLPHVSMIGEKCLRRNYTVHGSECQRFLQKNVRLCPMQTGSHRLRRSNRPRFCGEVRGGCFYHADGGCRVFADLEIPLVVILPRVEPLLLLTSPHASHFLWK